ncbi:hypothetical protein QQ045_012904 [Rhodiola kirilowii]
MEALLKLLLFTVSVLLLHISAATADQSFPTATSSSVLYPPPPSSSPPPPTHADFISATHYVAPVLTHLGFHEIASSVPSLAAEAASNPAAATWSGPFTIFAPSDSSVRSCPTCSIPRLLQEHIVPGVFTMQYLKKFAFGTKVETIVPGRCVTITSAVNNSRIFVGGVEITRPDLFNNGLFVVHGLEGYVAHLSPLSCNVERMTSLSFAHPTPAERTYYSAVPQMAVMRLMLTDAMLRLRISGFNILALALKVKFPELVQLQNMTVFTLDDISIFSGGQAYVSSVRFHIVPNQLLSFADLEKLPVGTVLPTLEQGQSLVVTTPGGGVAPMRINYVRIKHPDVMHNLRIVIHELFLPFPRIRSTTPTLGFGGTGFAAYPEFTGVGGFDAALGSKPAEVPVMTPHIKPAAEIDVEDHHGL